MKLRPHQIEGGTDGQVLTTVSGRPDWAEAAGGGVESVVAGANIAVDNTDPANPIISATGGGGGGGGRDLLATQVLAADAASVAFSTIPNTYQNLQLIMHVRSTGSTGSAQQDVAQIAFNGDTTTGNYGARLLLTVGSVNNTSSPNQAIVYVAGSASPAGVAAQADVLIANYAETVWQKTVRSQSVWRFSATAVALCDGATQWSNTAAITAMVLSLASGGNFVAGSEFRLYGLA